MVAVDTESAGDTAPARSGIPLATLSDEGCRNVDDRTGGCLVMPLRLPAPARMLELIVDRFSSRSERVVRREAILAVVPANVAVVWLGSGRRDVCTVAERDGRYIKWVDGLNHHHRTPLILTRLETAKIAGVDWSRSRLVVVQSLRGEGCPCRRARKSTKVNSAASVQDQLWINTAQAVALTTATDTRMSSSSILQQYSVLS